MRRFRQPLRVLVATATVFAGIAVPASAHATAPPRETTVSVGSVAIAEGDAGVRVIRVPVTLDAPVDHAVTVGWTLAGADGAEPGTPTGAATGADYRAATGTLTFPRSVVARSVNVAIFGDTRPETGETVTVNVVPQTAGVTLGSSGGVTIHDDEGNAAPAVTVGSVSLTEGDARTRAVSVPITLRTATAGASVTVRVVGGTATGGWSGTGVPPGGVDVGDRSGATRTILFGTATTRYLSVALAPDLTNEGSELATIEVVSAAPNLVGTAGSLTITDDDVPDDPGTGDFGPATSPVGSPAPDSMLVGCAQANTRITVTSSVHLDPVCTYTRGFEIGTSDVTLDCRGATIARPMGVTQSYGIRIAAPTTTALHDITVRNCTVSGFDNDLRITRTGFKDLAVGSEYVDAFARILIEHSSFLDSRNSGVFIDGFVTGVTMDHTLVDHAGAVGIYLEAGSTGTTISHSIVTDSGYKDIDAGPQSFTFGTTTVQYVSTGREGISVDGSSGNTIRDNYIARNAYGGIFLYKNCGENASEPGHWVRNYGSTDNAIIGNVIEDEPNAIWVASRAAENQQFMDCSDTPLVANPGGLQMVYLDPVVGTVIEFNRLRRVTRGIRIEGDSTVVRGNEIAATTHGVIVGTQFRTTVGSTPVAGTSILWNVVTGASAPYSWAWGTSGTTFTGNVGNGRNAGFPSGAQPGTGPFLMVDHFV